MWLFILFLSVPLIEIALFIQVGGAIGLFPTLGIVVLTAIIGTYLVRREGARALADLRRSMAELGDPSAPLAHGAMILFAGALLLTPGFFTDAVGFALLVPKVRVAVMKYVKARVKVQTFQYGTAAEPRPASNDVIDGEFSEAPAEHTPTHRPIGTTRH